MYKYCTLKIAPNTLLGKGNKHACEHFADYTVISTNNLVTVT